MDIPYQVKLGLLEDQVLVITQVADRYDQWLRLFKGLMLRKLEP